MTRALARNHLEQIVYRENPMKTGTARGRPMEAQTFFVMIDGRNAGA
jgi:hypothetical protein